MSHQIPLVLSLIEYEQAFDSADRKALSKGLSLYGIPDKSSCSKERTRLNSNQDSKKL